MSDLPAWVDESVYPFTSRFLDINGNQVHYVDEGAGATLLLAHGNPTWSFVYRDVIRALSAQFRCVAIDYPSFGLSTAKSGYGMLPADHSHVLATAIERLDLRDYILVIQDWGGPIGLSAALEAPERLKGLVIGNTWAWPVNGNKHFERFAKAMGGPIGRFGTRHFNLMVNAMLPLGHKRRKLTRVEMRHYRAALGTSQRRQAAAILPGQILDAHEFLADLQSRLSTFADRHTMIIWGDEDIAFQAPELAHWQEFFPSAPTVVLAGAGHFLQSDASDEFAEAIRTEFGAA